MTRGAICGQCEHFTIRDCPEQAAHGLGRCHGYDEPVELFVRWDEACVLFGLAKDQGRRIAWMRKRREHEAGNADGA